MIKLKDIELSSYHKTLLWVLSFTALFAKILLESIFLLFDQFSTPYAVIIRFALSLIVFISLLLIFYLGFKSGLNEWMASTEYFFKEVLQIIILNILLLIVSFFLPGYIVSGGMPRQIFDIIVINIFAFFSLFISIYSYKFLIKWIWIRRFNRTKIYIKIILIMTFLFILIIEIPNLFKHLNPEDIRNNEFLIVFSILFNIALFIIGWLASKKSSWIANLKLSEKWKLLGYSVLMITIETILFTLDLKYEGDGKISNALSYAVPSGSLLGISSLLLLIYFIRTMFSTILALPTSGIIEKKANELSSITYLNRLVSQTVDLDSLIDSVTKLALYSSGSIAVWTDIVDKNKGLIIKSCEHMDKTKFSCDSVSDELTNRFYSNLKDIEFIGGLNEPLYIESIRDFNNSSINELEKIFNAKSMIIMPLLSGNDRIGTLYLVHPDEYGFEQDYLNILRAFNDNINIAIENLRLIEVSIEQERYKKELMIARDIESRLIPAKLPEIENYSIAGLTIQSEEVGGDYFELVYLKDSTPCLLIADVSGKGLSAAFYMVLLKGVVLSVSGDSISAKDLLERINKMLYKQMENKIFITMSAINIKDAVGNVSIARAGHMPFLHKHNDMISEYKPSGIGIGLASVSIFNKHLEETTIRLENNDLLIMYSDGLTEMAENDNEPGEEFLKQILKKSVYYNSFDVLDNIRKETENIKQNSSISDDMTIVSIIYSQNKL